MALSTAIYNIIRADTNCLTTFGDRIFPVDFPQKEGKKWPSVVYSVDSVDLTHTTQSESNWDEYTVSMTLFAETYTNCETYAGYLRDAFNRYVGSTGGKNVVETNLISMSDGPIENIGQGEASTTGIGLFTKNITVTITIAT